MSVEMTDDQREALETLVASEGWQLYRAYVDREWGDPAVVSKIRTALAPVDRGDHAAITETTTQILTAQAKIRDLMEWPTRTLGRIERAITVKPPDEPVLRRDTVTQWPATRRHGA